MGILSPTRSGRLPGSEAAGGIESVRTPTAPVGHSLPVPPLGCDVLHIPLVVMELIVGRINAAIRIRDSNESFTQLEHIVVNIKVGELTFTVHTRCTAVSPCHSNRAVFITFERIPVYFHILRCVDPQPRSIPLRRLPIITEHIIPDNTIKARLIEESESIVSLEDIVLDQVIHIVPIEPPAVAKVVVTPVVTYNGVGALDNLRSARM